MLVARAERIRVRILLFAFENVRCNSDDDFPLYFGFFFFMTDGFS